MYPISITVDVDDWFEHPAVTARYRDIESLKRGSVCGVCKGVPILLRTLKKFEIKTTFFVLGRVVEEYPDLVSKIRKDGHEISSHGMYHTDISKKTIQTFRNELKKNAALLTNVAVKPLGFRAPCLSLPNWARAILLKEGFKYDSSVVSSIPIPGWYGNVFAPTRPCRIENLLEIPVFSAYMLPIGGGWWVRNFMLGRPLKVNYLKLLNKAALERPVVLYLHPYEFVDVPQLDVPRHFFRNCGSPMQKWLEEALGSITLKDMRLSNLANRLGKST